MGIELRVVAVSNVGITVVSLVRWMHRVRADAAGRYETTVLSFVRSL